MEGNWEWDDYLDSETGEKRKGGVRFEGLSRDAETGEPKIKEIVLGEKFQIPLDFLQRSQEKIGKKLKPRRKRIHGFYWRREEIRSNLVKEFVICKRRNVGAIVFMLPTFFICPAWASILCLLGEACMHIWSHQRNRKMKSGNVEYRSPFHLISSQFCVHCRSQKWMKKISQIQDKRNLKRKLIYQNFRPRVV